MFGVLAGAPSEANKIVGSTSSMSGKQYEIRYDDGHVVTSETFLRARLAKLEK